VRRIPEDRGDPVLLVELATVGFTELVARTLDVRARAGQRDPVSRIGAIGENVGLDRRRFDFDGDDPLVVDAALERRGVFPNLGDRISSTFVEVQTLVAIRTPLAR
jgi:hypothetical protein